MTKTELNKAIMQANRLYREARQAAQAGDQARAAELRAQADEIWSRIEREAGE